MKKIKWAYGITTVPSRQHSYFPKTLESLKGAGFTHPTIFVDGDSGDYAKYKLPVVYRSSQIRAFGNWFLALHELWIRNPSANRFALFQDDFVCSRGIKEYLDRFELPDGVYWNLYTFPQNEKIRTCTTGWYASNQRGRGAVALVFPAAVVLHLLTSYMMQTKCREPRFPDRCIDGTIINTLSKVNVKEYVHFPTLVQHIGDCSSIGNRQHQKPDSFRGTEFNAMNFLKETVLT